MSPSWRRWRRGHRHVAAQNQGRGDPTAPDESVTTAEEVDELANEIAELRHQADDLRHQLKETEARLGAVEDDSEEQARIIDTLLDWCHEQESVLAQHRDVVAAMGAATRILERDAPLSEREPAVKPADEQPSP